MSDASLAPPWTGQRRSRAASARRSLVCGLALVTLGGSLGGCVAAAIPVAAGAALRKAARHHRVGAVLAAKQASTRKARRAARTRSAGTVRPVATEPPAAEFPASAAPQPVLGATQAADAIIAPPTPAPSPAPATSAMAPPRASYADFAAAAIARARPTLDAPVRQSVVLDPKGSLFAPRWLPCGAMAPAVVIDLDPGQARIDPEHALSAAAGLSAATATLRQAGVKILWSSRRPRSDEDAIRQRLRAAGVDGDGVDRLLLIAKPDDRKQTRLRDAARAWCVVAIAGDRRGDFDELFDYLRNPADAAALEPVFGTGWFVTLPPLSR